MSGMDELVDDLVAADRIVLAGLKAFDQVMVRTSADALKTAAKLMAENGHSVAEIEGFSAAHKDGVAMSRGKLHRELWLRALGQIRLPPEFLASAAQAAGGGES